MPPERGFQAGKSPLQETLVAPLVAALVLATEAAVGVMRLGWLFDRFDVSAETTG